jgi:hypothetical protein
MQATGWQARRSDDGAIDYEFYRAEAGRLRADAKRSFSITIGRAIVDQIRRWVAFRQASSQAQATITRKAQSQSG